MISLFLSHFPGTEAVSYPSPPQGRVDGHNCHLYCDTCHSPHFVLELSLKGRAT